MTSSNFLKKLLITGFLVGSTIVGSEIYAQSQDSSKNERKVDDLEKQAKVTMWYEDAKKDLKSSSADSIKSMIQKDLYDGSVVTWVPAKDFQFKEFDGQIYNPLLQVSDNGRFPDAEKERWLSTTYAAFANKSGMNIEEIKKAVSLSEGIPYKYISVSIDNKGTIIDPLYVGPKNLFKNHTKHMINNGEVLSGHILWDKDQVGWMPVDATLRLMGYNLDATNDFINIIEDQKSVIDSLDDKNYNLELNLIDANYVNSELSDSLKNVRDRENEYHLIFSYGKNWNSDDSNKDYVKNQLGKDSWAIYSSIPVFDLNSIMVGAGYSKKDMYNGPVIDLGTTHFTEPHPTNPNWTGHSLLERKKSENLSQDKLFGFIGYEIADDLYVGPRVEKIMRDGLEITSEKSTTWMQTSNGHRLGENTLGPISKTRKLEDNFWGAGIEAHYITGPVDFNAYFTKSLNNNSTSFGAGVGLDFAQIIRYIK